MVRVSLTQKQLKTPEGQELLDLLMEITRDGLIDYDEVDDLNEWLEENAECDLPAVGYLRDMLETLWRDKRIDVQDQWQLLLAIERVLPPDQRALAKVRRRDTPEPATQRQIDFLASLGIDYGRDLSKLEAMELIDEEKEQIAQLKELERDLQGPSRSPRKKRSKRKGKRSGCSGCMLAVVALLVLVGYCEHLRNHAIHLSPPLLSQGDKLTITVTGGLPALLDLRWTPGGTDRITVDETGIATVVIPENAEKLVVSNARGGPHLDVTRTIYPK